MRYLHTMLRITDPEASLEFFCNRLGLVEVMRKDSEQGRYTLGTFEQLREGATGLCGSRRSGLSKRGSVVPNERAQTLRRPRKDPSRPGSAGEAASRTLQPSAVAMATVARAATHDLRLLRPERAPRRVIQRFLNFLAAPNDLERAREEKAPLVELTWNWDPEELDGGRSFGHLAYRVDDIYAVCRKLMDAGVTINRPPRDGHMAFVRSPDGHSIELLQEGEHLPPAEPWASMPNTGSW